MAWINKQCLSEKLIRQTLFIKLRYHLCEKYKVCIIPRFLTLPFAFAW
ncbi:hypothetical protein HMPREF9370_1697 [Neisseria wadsworthii 9715]|uniref:Uncharacterized protein n=1 Tax=Neisseria wadsworthii 9715 TaxID=1030841 RepID=G4CRI7_9NEIS|nr:hypothetical protein HMPREF9370_1697 [Neisseria wadsworthii 9715]